MKLQSLMPVLLLSAMLSAPALADDRNPLDSLQPLLTPQGLLGGILAEDDVNLLFAHLRASMLAASEGREPPSPPAALSRRIDKAAEELRARGTLIGLMLSAVMETAVRDAVREFAPVAPRSND